MDLDSAVSNLDKWKNMDVVVRDVYTEEDINNNIDIARTGIKHEEQLYDKFMRLQVRFLDNYKKLSEGIASYKSYLEVKLKSYSDAMIYINALNLGAMTFEEFSDSSQKNKIVLEEFERKIDVLLNE